MKVSKFRLCRTLPYRREIMTSGFAVVIGAINISVAAVLWDSFLAKTLALVGFILIAVGLVLTTQFLTGAVTDIYTPQHLVDMEHMKRLTTSLKMIGARNENSSVPLQEIKKYWYDKCRVNSLVEKGYIGRTNDGRLYLIREMEA